MKTLIFTTSVAEAPPVELTLETLQEAINKLVNIPPFISKIFCSEKTINHFIKNFKEESIAKNFKNALGVGVAICKDDLLKHGQLSLFYSNGQIKIIQAFTYGCQCCGPNQFCEYQSNQIKL